MIDYEKSNNQTTLLKTNVLFENGKIKVFGILEHLPYMILEIQHYKC